MVEDDPPFVGKAALLVGSAAVVTGALAVAGVVTAYTWARYLARRLKP